MESHRSTNTQQQQNSSNQQHQIINNSTTKQTVLMKPQNQHNTTMLPTNVEITQVSTSLSPRANLNSTGESMKNFSNNGVFGSTGQVQGLHTAAAQANQPQHPAQQQQFIQNVFQNQSQQQADVKKGRIGIFGNYLASRISSIQQQKFLLNKSQNQQQGKNPVQVLKQNVAAAVHNNKSGQTSPRNSTAAPVKANDQSSQPSKPAAEYSSQTYQEGSKSQPPTSSKNATQAASVVNMDFQFQTAAQTLNTNKLAESLKQRGEHARRNGGEIVHLSSSSQQNQQQRYLPTESQDNAKDGSSPLVSKKKIDPPRHSLEISRWPCNGQFQGGPQQPHLPQQPQVSTNIVMMDPSIVDQSTTLPKKIQTTKPANQSQSSCNNKTNGPRKNTPNTTAPQVNKSYQGGPVGQVKEHQFGLGRGSQSSASRQQQLNNVVVSTPAATKTMNFQEPPTFFTSGTFGEEQFSTWDNKNSASKKQQQNYHQMIMSGGNALDHPASTYCNTQNPSASVNFSQHKAAYQQPQNQYSSQLSSLKPTQQRTDQGQKQNSQSSMLQNIRSHSQTPHQEGNILLTTAGDETIIQQQRGGGDVSPMQIRRRESSQAAANTSQIHYNYNQNQKQYQQSNSGQNSISAVIVHRSFEQQVDIAIDKIQEARNLKQTAVAAAKKVGALPRVDRSGNQVTKKKTLDTQAAAIAFQNSAGSAAQFMDSSRLGGASVGRSAREELIKRGTTKQYLNSANLPINNKLNAALRQNGKLGLGPCLEERQMNMIDKIWGNFNSEYDEGSKKQLMVTSARMSGNGNESQKASQPVSLIDPMKKRKRNELFYAQSGGAVIHQSHNQAVRVEETPPTAVFLQHSENSESTTANPAAPGARGKMNSTDDRKQYLTQLTPAVTDDTNSSLLTGSNLQNCSSSNPVWLPKKALMHRNTVAGAPSIAMPEVVLNGRRSQNIDETELAIRRNNGYQSNAATATQVTVEDESFDYKDFNFIVGKQKSNAQFNGPQNNNNLPTNKMITRSNSPSVIRNARYAAEQQNQQQSLKIQAMSENYHRMKQYGQKRLSSEILTSSQIPLSKNQQNPKNHAASIKIQIEDQKKQQMQLQQRSSNPEAYMQAAQQANALFRSSQTNLYKIDQNASTAVASAAASSTNHQNAYLSLSQKKKNQQYWNVANSRPLPKDELKSLYHVTIQIDPSVPTPPNRQSPGLSNNTVNSRSGANGSGGDRQKSLPNSPYQHQPQHPQLPQHYNIVKHGVLPQKQHVLQGIPGTYNVNSNPFEANPQFFEVGATRNAAQVSAASQNRNGPGMLSPRSLDRKAMVFSPEPKLIELLAEESHRMKTIPIMYPIIPKRQQQFNQKDINSDKQVIVDQSACLMHLNSTRETHQDETTVEQDGGDTGIDNGSPTKRGSGVVPAQYSRQPYFCPYAKERMAKQRAERERRATEGMIPGAKTASVASANVAGSVERGDGNTTEESKTDLKTAEQKAEELKNHQKELMRKFLSKFPPKKLPNLHAELEEERQRFVQARKEANKKYTEISANNNKPGKFGPLKFVIFEGNNSNIVRRVMQSRLACNMPELSEAPGSPAKISKTTGDQTTTASEGESNNFQAGQSFNNKLAIQNYTTWQETNAPHLFNFKWKPTSYGINFERLGKFGYKQLVNHIDGHQALTTKDQLFFNMKTYCEKKNIDVYDMIPLTFAVDFQDHNHNIKFDQILQILSLFEKNISLPPTELNAKLQFAQSAFDKVIRSPLSVGPSEHQGKNLWLLKPTGFNRGIGIHVFNSIDDLQNILWTHYRIQVNVPQHYRNQPQSALDANGAESSANAVSKDFSQRDKEIQKLSNQIAQDEQNADPEAKQQAASGVKEIKNSSFIVQKYIEAPLLFRRRKFDIRIWALISHDAKFYLFKEAYVRTSSEEYDLSGDKLDQVYVHLTNNAVQKYSKNYGKFEEGNIVSVKTLSEELASQEQFASSLTADQIEKSLYKQMREQIQHSYEAIRSKLKFSKHSFELVGYDFMVVPVLTPPATSNSNDDNCGSGDVEFKTKMIEANTNPCLEESNQLLKDLIPRMLDDMLKIVLDPLFGTTLVPQEQAATETETGMPVHLKYPIEGYQDSESMFDLIASPPMQQQQ